MAVTFNTFSRPIESGLESNHLVSSADTCEQCHAGERVIGPCLRVLTQFKNDESNSRTETVLMMRVGGGSSGRIHGSHMPDQGAYPLRGPHSEVSGPQPKARNKWGRMQLLFHQPPLLQDYSHELPSNSKSYRQDCSSGI
jgi:hypothetical protein